MNPPAVVPFPLAGELFALASAFIWAASIALFTRASAGYSPTVLNLFKGIISIVCLVIALALKPPGTPSDPAAWWLLPVSGLVGIVVGDWAFFAALQRLGAQVTSASQCLAPPFAALLAMGFLSETLSATEAMGITVTVSAVAWMLLSSRRAGEQLAKHSRRDLAAGVGYALVAALCQAAGVVMARKGLAATTVLLGATLRIAPATLGCWLVCEAYGERTALKRLFADKKRARTLAIASFGGTFLGITLMTAATKFAKAGVVVAMSSTYPVWILPIAALYLGEKVTWRTASGALLAVLGMFLLLLGKG